MTQQQWATFVRPEEAGRILGLSPSTLAKWRMTGDGPPFQKLSARCVRYAVADLEAWMASRTRLTTEKAAA